MERTTCFTDDIQQQQGLQVLNIGEEHAFWWNGQPKLCALLRKTLGVDSLETLRNSTTTADQQQAPAPPVLVNLTLNCTHITHDAGLGTGNWLVAFYMTRILSSYANAHFQFQCHNNDCSWSEDVLAHLQQCYPPLDQDHWPVHTVPIPVTEKLLCAWDMFQAPVSLALSDIQKDMRRLVRTVLPHSDKPPPPPTTTTLVATNGGVAPPPVLYIPTHRYSATRWFGNNVFFDDVAIHFRCGDVLNLTRPRGDYGITRFAEYTKRISPEARSIGIVTQPFEPSRNRPHDQAHTGPCQTLVESLVRYLRRSLPHVESIAIRNGPHETLVLAYVRLAVANQTLTSLSSFSAFPILAQYGENHFEKGRMQVNRWLNHLGLPHVHPIEGDLLRNHRIMKENSMEFVLKWLNLF